MENKRSAIPYAVWGILGVGLLTALDQWTKQLAARCLAGQPDIILIPKVFQLRYVENRGAAFGVLQNQIVIFVILTLIYLAAVLWVYFRIPRNKKYLIFHITAVVLTAGALGNFIDRIRLGYVVDFFYFSLIDFPVFNVADILVVTSFSVLAVCILFLYGEDDFAFLMKKKRE